MLQHLRPVIVSVACLFVCVASIIAAATATATASAAAANASAATPPIWITADTEGHIAPCNSCPEGSGYGGLSKRATLLKQLRKEHPHGLLLDAGNALFGGTSLHTKGRAIVAAYNQLGYDAVNIGYRDFRLGKQATLDALTDAKFTPVSANLYDAQTNKRLFKPFVVYEIENEKIAVVGITERPAALDVLPHLRKQFEGVTIHSMTDTMAQLPRKRMRRPTMWCCCITVRPWVCTPRFRRPKNTAASRPSAWAVCVPMNCPPPCKRLPWLHWRTGRASDN